jgi:uncharacterized protein YecE (DUF72 family)
MAMRSSEQSEVVCRNIRLFLPRIWKGVVYPRSLKREVADLLRSSHTCSRFFNTCEINATFPRLCEPEIAKPWSDAIENPGFEFAFARLPSRLRRWRSKVEREPSRRWIKEVIAATNNHYKGEAAVNAIDLKRLLGIKDSPVPEELLKP